MLDYTVKFMNGNFCSVALTISFVRSCVGANENHIRNVCKFKTNKGNVVQ